MVSLCFFYIPPMPTCQVRHCRFPSSHATCDHRCGTCGMSGHGQLECGSPTKIQALVYHPLFRRSLPPSLWCTATDCPTYKTHTTAAHHCDVCGRHGLTNHTISCAKRSATCPLCKVASVAHRQVFTGSDCVICMEAGPVVVFEACAHAVVCQTCVERL